jgi:hypothetical protein
VIETCVPSATVANAQVKVITPANAGSSDSNSTHCTMRWLGITSTKRASSTSEVFAGFAEDGVVRSGESQRHAEAPARPRLEMENLTRHARSGSQATTAFDPWRSTCLAPACAV